MKTIPGNLSLDKISIILTEREYKVIKMHLFDNYTLIKCAEILCISKERVRQIEAKALRKLQNIIDSEPKMISFKNGMTVRDLKQIITDWPEEDEFGNPTEVWIGHNNLSDQVTVIVPLNLRESEDGKWKWADLLLAY